MIIGVSGAQGQGKSTLIKAALKDGWYFDLGLQTSRETLNDWGYSLSEVNSYIPLKIKFQEELFSRHCAGLDGHKGVDLGNPTTLVERTFADIFAYALLSVGPFNDHSVWLNDYAARCSEAQQDYFDHIVFLSGREYTPENDGVRSINPHFSDMADHLISKYTNLFGNVTHLRMADLGERVAALSDINERLKTGAI